MNNPNIDSLLEKYWQGETSLDDERDLRNFFQQEQVSEQYEALRPLFVGIPEAATAQPSSEAEAKWLKTLGGLEAPAEGGAKVIGMSPPRRNWWRIAAVALILIGVGSVWTNTIREQQRQEAMVAYNETKKALAMVGIHFENGKDRAAKNLRKASKNLDIIQPN